MVEVVTAIQQARERRPLESYGVEHGLALGSAGQPVELGEEVAQDVDGPALPALRQEGAGEAFEVGDPIPVRRGGRRWRPLRPVRVDRLACPLLAAVVVNPCGAQAQVRVQIGEPLDEW